MRRQRVCRERSYADVEGYDACRKIAILTSLVCGQQVDFEDIHTEGITKITPTDIKQHRRWEERSNCSQPAKKGQKAITAIVAPFLLPASHPLYAVNGVFNAIFVHGNVLGDAMFYGSGAGKLPTASAVVADVVEMAKNLDKNIPIEWSSKKTGTRRLQGMGEPVLYPHNSRQRQLQKEYLELLRMYRQKA